MSFANIAVIGSLMVDHIVVVNRLPDRGETYPANRYHEALGGKGANAAISAHRSCHQKPTNEETSSTPANSARNVNVRMVGAVGNDEYASVFKDALEGDGVNASGVRTVEGKATAMPFIMVEEASRDNRIISVAGATDALSPEDFAKVEDLGSGISPDLVILQLEISTNAVEQILETAGKAEIDVLLNASPANDISLDKYRFITHLLVNEPEAAMLCGLNLEKGEEETWYEIAQEFLNKGVKNVVITLGAEGAFYANAQVSGHAPAFEIVPVDPTGAGDTFTGAYASEYVRQKQMQEPWDIQKAVIRANKAAAFTVSTLGAQEGIPWANEIDEFAVSDDAPQTAEPGIAAVDELVA